MVAESGVASGTTLSNTGARRHDESAAGQDGRAEIDAARRDEFEAAAQDRASRRPPSRMVSVSPGWRTIPELVWPRVTE
jgi:hypothetical protein